MRQITLSLFVSLLFISTARCQTPSLITPYEQHKTNYTATYQECYDWYQRADSAFENVKVLNYGLTDCGKPLQLAVVSQDKDFSPESLRKKNKRIILIMNAIHPGEPEGVDASMLLVRDMASRKEWKEILKNVVVCIIPQYNIGGVLNRGSYSRANQNGPESYGFRGNGQNLDLNRDFIKCDSRNARSFAQLFQEWQPDVFIDNHTSDGADYQYTLTYIANTPGTLPQPLDHYLNDKLTSAIDKICSKDGFEMAPYVECMKESPDSGIMGFNALPRYSMGYTGLWNTLSYTVETHMLKPFDKRLQATYAFMKACITQVHTDADLIARLRKEALQTEEQQSTYILNREMDTTRYYGIDFKGYEAGHKPSQVSGLPRLYYDENKPYDKKIRFYNVFNPTLTIQRPDEYIVPQDYWRVIELLQMNGVSMTRLDKDTTLNLDMYVIDSFRKPGRIPYNDHYQHSQVILHTQKVQMTYHEGDYIIKTAQPAINYIMETLEPQGEDSYFAWNFFDGILQQQEYFSSYVFEDMAHDYLQKHPELNTELEAKKKANPAFAANARAQLDWVYHHSPWFEKTCMRYPVGRVMK